MPLHKHLLFLNLAYAAKHAMGQDVAIVVKKWATLGLGLDNRKGGPGAGTAVANALQNLATTLRLDECDIYVTSPPTDLCLGMARICRIKSVVLIDQGEIVRYKPQEPVTAGGFPSGTFSTPEIKMVSFKLKGGAPPHAALPDLPASDTPLQDAFAWWLRASQGNAAAAWYQPPAEGAVATFDGSSSFSRVEAPALVPVQPLDYPILPSRDSIRETLFMTLAYAIAAVTWDRIDAWEGNKVACILVDPTDRIVSWGINMKDGQNVTWHGETVTLRRFLGARKLATLTPGYRLYTTLKPCYMCAGMIAEVAPSMTVIYGQDDPEIVHNTLTRQPGRFTQRASLVLRNPRETFPQLLARLLNTVGGNAIPFLQNLSPAHFQTSFGRALGWLDRIDDSLRNQFHLAARVNSRDPRHRSLAALDLAVRDRRQIADDVWILKQGLDLLDDIGARLQMP